MANLNYGTGLDLQSFITNGDEFVTATLANWGLSETDATFSDQARSISSIGIGPDSDFARVMVRYATPIYKSQGGQRYNQQFKYVTISPKTPFLAALRDGQRPSISPNTLNILELYAIDTYSSAYSPQGGGAAVNLTNDAFLFRPADLQLILSANNHKLPATSGKRNDKTYSANVDDTYWATVVNGNEAPCVAVPIIGRKRACVTLRSVENGVFNVRISAVPGRYIDPDKSGIYQGTGAWANNDVQLAPGGWPATTPLPINSELRFDLALQDYALLIVHATRTSGGDDDQLIVTIRVSDD